MSSIQGNPGAVRTKTEFGYDRQSGKFVQITWEGTQDAIAGNVANIGNPDSYLMGPTGAGSVWQLVARYGNTEVEGGGSEVPVREERLRWNIVTKSIFQSPRFALSDEEISILRKVIDDNRKFSDLEISQISEDGLVLFAMAKRGVESIYVNQPVVVVTDTASAEYAWDIGFDNVGKIFDTQDMIADAELVSGWKANLPNEGAPNEFFLYGWHKKPPEITTAGVNRTQLVQEYEYGLWHVAQYDAA